MNTAPRTRVKVRSCRAPQGAWLTTIYLDGRIEDSNISFSWLEAMQQAHAMLASLDRALMDEVHASRATRREAVASEETLADAAAEFAAMIAAGRSTDYAMRAAGTKFDIGRIIDAQEPTA